MKRRKNPDFESEITIEYLNERGYGVGFVDGKEVQVLNTLPGEKVKVKIFKKRKGILLAQTEEILEKSNNRVDAKESHFLSCSPWQIIPIDEENLIKKNLIKKFYKDNCDFELEDFDIFSNFNDYNYRNKVEFAFYGFDDERVSLAYHARESGFHKITLDSCALLPEKANLIAKKIIEFINNHNIRARQLKGLLLRYSYFEDKVFAGLFVKDDKFMELLKDVNIESELNQDYLKGFKIIHSDFRSPAFVETDILFSFGDNNLIEEIAGNQLIYPYNGFFQINPPIFEQSVEDMSEYIKNIPNSKSLRASDIYAGVGTIGLSLASYLNHVIGVEITPTTKQYALNNAELNKIENFEFYEGLAEREGLEFIKTTDILVLDPPRVGVHQKVLKQIIDYKPQYIIYLSCNPKTQADNFNEIKDLYDIKYFKAYNFYPHTPHVESLCIMEIKN